VIDLLDSRGIQRAVLVGHSHGGGVALAAATLAPVPIRAARQLAQVLPDTGLQLVRGAGRASVPRPNAA
jgi:pimeloyl-ACP methyl ester carboxylesterase